MKETSMSLAERLPLAIHSHHSVNHEHCPPLPEISFGKLPLTGSDTQLVEAVKNLQLSAQDAQDSTNTCKGCLWQQLCFFLLERLSQQASLSRSESLARASRLLETELTYRPLNFANFETRFLRISPADLDTASVTPVSCEVIHGSLVDAPGYVALSYCWGDHGETVPIIVNGAIVAVTVNLERALRELRTRRVETVWVDAICINQSDNYERQYQVSRMGHIYSKASNVVAWLGAASYESDLAVAYLNNAELFLPDDGEALAAVSDLLQRPYWRRVWIVQELAKGAAVQIWCGSRSIQWKALERFVRSTMVRSLPADDFQTLQTLHSFYDEEHRNRVSKPRMLHSEAVLRTYHSNATDPRDKVYALLALTRNGSEVVPIPNYLQPALDLFQQVAAYSIEQQGLNSWILLAGRSQQVEHAPSWLPVWDASQAQRLPTLPAWIVKGLTRDVGQYQSRKAKIRGSVLEVEGSHLETLELHPKQLPRSERFIVSDQHVEYVLRELCDLLQMDAEVEDVDPANSAPFLQRRPLQKEINHMKAVAVTWSCMEDGWNDDDPIMKDWLAHHGAWIFQGHPIYAWLEDHHIKHNQYGHATSQRALSERKVRRLNQEASLQYQLMRAGLKTMQRNSMKIVATEEGPFRVVYHAAKTGDRIYRLRNCPLPVVLRPLGSDKFEFVGEVFMRSKVKGGDLDWGPFMVWQHGMWRERREWKPLEIV